MQHGLNEAAASRATLSMKDCIDSCEYCHRICLNMATNHCLEIGGKHAEPEHLKLMLACAEICQAAANFQLIDTPFHHQLCGLCAQICEACAQSCEQIGEMEDCVAACRECAQSCRQMAGDRSEKRVLS